MIIRKNINTGETKEYSSKSQAARELGLDESTVRKAIKFNKTVKGVYKFSRTEEPNPLEVKSSPKILIIDCETAPLRSYTWGLWKQNVGLSQIISNWYMISFACKLLGEEEVYSAVLTPEEAVMEDDSRIVKEIWHYLDNADIVIAHNGDKFDIPKINTRFVLHGLVPPSSYKQIDTLTTARQMFGFTSNRLDYLAKFFGYEGKVHTEFSLWEDCMMGNEDALYYMEYYNKQDVVILEKVYLKLRPFMRSHPNLGLYNDSDAIQCPHCGSSKILPVKDKYFYTSSVRYKIYRCECGAISRAKKGEVFLNKKQISPIPR